MAAPNTFGNPVRGRVGPLGKPDPVSRFVITRGFADESMPQYGTHDALDIDNGGAQGDDILAMEAGRVYQAFFDPNSGGAGIVRIDHGGGWTTGYAHMDKLYVAHGAQVTKGQRIGSLDSTGWVTGPHLHYDTTLNGVRKDPEPYLNRDYEEEDMGPWGSGDFERLTNEKWLTKEGAKFYADTSRASTLLGTFAIGKKVVPWGRAQGQPLNDNPWWYLATLWVGGKYRSGAFHRSGLDTRTELYPPAPDVDAAEKAAADAVRDAGVTALNTAAKVYGA